MLEMLKKILFNKDTFEGSILPSILVLAGIGIACAVIAHYLSMGFRPLWFLLFDVPLYLLLGWACWKCWKMWKRFKNM